MWILAIKNFSGINFTLEVIETLYFWYPVFSHRIWTFWYFFSENYVSLINYDITLRTFEYSWKFRKCNLIVYSSWITWTTWTYFIFPLTFDCKIRYANTKKIPTDHPFCKTQKHPHKHRHLFPDLWNIL